MSVTITCESSHDAKKRIRVLKDWRHKCPLNKSVVRELVGGQKSKEINSHLVRVLGELLDDLELVLTVTCTLVGGDGIARHAVVDSAGTIVARYIGNSWNRRAILASWGIFVKRDVATSTYECARGLV